MPSCAAAKTWVLRANCGAPLFHHSQSKPSLNSSFSGTPDSSASSNRNIVSKYLSPTRTPSQSMSSYIIFSCSISENVVQEKDVETQRLSQVLLSVAGIIDRHLFLSHAGTFPVFLISGQSVPIRYPHSFLSWNLCPIKEFADSLIRTLVMKDGRFATFILAHKFANIQRKLQARIPQRPKRGDTLDVQPTIATSPFQALCFSNRPGGDLPTLLCVPKSIEPRPLLSPPLLKLFDLIASL